MISSNCNSQTVIPMEMGFAAAATTRINPSSCLFSLGVRTPLIWSYILTSAADHFHSATAIPIHIHIQSMKDGQYMHL